MGRIIFREYRYPGSSGVRARRVVYPSGLAVLTMDHSIFEAQADFCKTMGNASRLQLLHILRDGPSTVKDLAQKAGMTQAAVSRQLAALRSVGVVISRRNRQEVIYQLADPKIGEVCDMVRQVLVERILKDTRMLSPATKTD